MWALPREVRSRRESGVFHGPDGISGRLPLFADGMGQDAVSDLTSVRTRARTAAERVVRPRLIGGDSPLWWRR